MKPLAIAVLLLLSTTAVASAECPQYEWRARTPLELADSAARVVAGKVTARRGHDVTLAVRATAKGDDAATVVVHQRAADCTRTRALARGAKVIVFLDAAGHLVGDGDGVMPDRGDWILALERWSGAATAADRVAVLVDLIEQGGAGEIAGAAAQLFADRPDLLVATDAGARRRLLAAEAGAAADSMLPVVLARLHVANLHAQLPAPRRSPRVDLLVQAIRGADVESITSTTALAAMIALGDGGSFAAMERCERVRGTRLASIYWYTAATWSGPVDFFTALAEMCQPR